MEALVSTVPCCHVTGSRVTTSWCLLQVLLARGVLEEKIILLCIIAAPEGVHRICSRFPKVRLVASQIDDHVDAHFAVVPGCGEFGDRCDALQGHAKIGPVKTSHGENGSWDVLVMAKSVKGKMVLEKLHSGSTAHTITDGQPPNTSPSSNSALSF